MDQYLYKAFEMYWPNIARDTVECYEVGPDELIAKLKDGRVFSYYNLHTTIRQLPTDDESLDEARCRYEFGLRLYRILERKGISQRELSERTGITQANISNYINGKVTPSFYVTDKIARAIGCSTEDLRLKY